MVAITDYVLVATPLSGVDAPGPCLGATAAPIGWTGLPAPAQRWVTRQTAPVRVAPPTAIGIGPTYDLSIHAVPWGDIVLEHPTAATVEGWVWMHTLNSLSHVWPATRGQWHTLVDTVRAGINAALAQEYGDERVRLDGDSNLVVPADRDYLPGCEVVTDYLNDEDVLDGVWRRCLSPAR